MNRLILGVVACVVVLMGCGVGYGEQDLGVASQEQSILSGGSGGDPDDPQALLTLTGMSAVGVIKNGSSMTVTVKVTTSGGEGACPGTLNVFQGNRWMGGSVVSFTGNTYTATFVFNDLSDLPDNAHAWLWSGPGCMGKRFVVPVVNGGLRL